MKKIIILLFVGLLAISLSACKKEEEIEQPEIVGGWSVLEQELDDELLKIFNKATEGLTGAGYEPIKLIGTQVVAGTNYRFLCNQTLVTANPETKQVVVTIYEALDGTCSITDVSDYEK